MVERITYGDKEPGDLFTADDADEIRTAVNGLGTAADADTGTTAGCVPVIESDGYLPASIIPGGGGGGGGSGDVTGPGTSTDGRVVLFDGTAGTALKQGTAVQTLPTTATDGYWLTVTSGALAWSSTASMAAALGALTTTDRIPYTGIHGLDSSGAGALAAAGLIGSGGMTAGQAWVTNAGEDGVEGLTLGSAALLDAVPSGAPTSASSSSGAITLDFAGITTIETTTTEAITSVTLSNITAYSTVLWRVKHTTARDITFPAAKISWPSGSLTYAGVANSTVNFVIYNDNGSYEIVASADLVAGA